MKLKTLCTAALITYPAEVGGREVTAIVTDSRDVTPGALFVCIRGLHTDGHTYIAEAARKGAAFILTEDGADYQKIPNTVFLRAKNTRKAVSCLYNAFYGFPASRLKFIGVTGTNGKTTVTHMLRSILNASLCRCGLIGTVGCESVGRHLENRMRDRNANMTTPDPQELYRMLAEMVSDGVEYVLMEVTSHALVLGKLEPIRFEAAVFTNLTPEHLDFHGSMENYADAKAMLFRASKISILNGDSPYAERMRAAAGGRVVTCTSTGKEADYRACEIRLLGQSGVEYHISSDKTCMRIICPIPGSFTVMNSMQAAVCARELGFGSAAIKDSLASILGVRGRMERVRLGPGADFTVLIDYAHTPDALENLLYTARDFSEAGQRIVLVFGCGGDRDRSKRPVMGAVASRLADEVIVTADNSRSESTDAIIEEILSGMDTSTPRMVISDRAAAIRHAVLNARAGDIILLAGKGHEEYEINRNGRMPFSEKNIVRDAFAQRVKRERNDNSTEAGLQT